jgi:type VI secretion system protein ImpM
MEQVTGSGARALSLVGKIPAQADFVRENVTRAVTQFDQWLTRAMADVNAAGQRLPAVVIRFALRSADAQRLLVGVLTPSSDQVGRSFPLALVCELDAEPWCTQWNGLPLACAETLDGLQALAFEIPALPLPDVRDRLQRHTPPAPATLHAAAVQVARTLDGSAAATFLADAFPGQDQAAVCYGLHTFCAAASSGSARGAAQSIVVDCPIAIDLHLMAWLDLAQRLGAAADLGGVFWIEEPEPRMLLCVGPPPGQVLHLLSDPQRSSQLLWPLGTQVEAARQHALQVIGPRIAPALADPQASVTALWRALAGG